MTQNPEPSRTNRLSRRAYLATTVAAAGAVAGCLGDDSDSENGDTASGDGEPSAPEPVEGSNAPSVPAVENPPEAVYLPTHQEAMEHLPTVEAGDFAVTPMVTYPHKFWLVNGSQREEVTPSSTGVHLMATVWDSETGSVLPVDTGAQTRVLRDGERIDQRAPWPMISQTMGFHFGDNVALPEQGTYTVELDLNPIEQTVAHKTGAFAGRFEEAETVSFEFEFDQEFQEAVVDGVEYFEEDRWGERAAVEPLSGMDGGMEMSMPYSALQAAEAYPGRDLGTPASGDATFVVRYLEQTELSERSTGYLLVSPRTPYNRVPLADTALSVTGALEAELVQTLDSDLGHHYGVPADLSAGDRLEIVVESPPQVARHRGYETAFLDMPSMTVEVP